MRDKSKTLHGQNAGLQTGRINRADQSQPQYNSSTELIQDCQKFEREYRGYRDITPEPRVCVYGIPSSVPFSRRWI